MTETGSLGERIRQARTRLSLTQSQLADEMRRDRSTIVAWEAGTRIPGPGDASILALKLRDPGLGEGQGILSALDAARALRSLGWSCAPPRRPEGSREPLDGRWSVLGEWSSPLVGGVGRTPLDMALQYSDNTERALRIAQEITARFNRQAGECGPILAGAVFLARDLGEMGPEDSTQAWICVSERIRAMREELDRGVFAVSEHQNF